MKRYPLLDVCARIEGHKLQHRLLREYCRQVTSWEEVLSQAEKEGLAPLLKKHLEESGSDYPVAVRRSLDILYKRHQHQAMVRLGVLQEVLQLFDSNGLKVMVIKGAALCYTTYPDPALRPMRDMDLLFHPSEVDHAQKLMRDAGFSQSKAAIPRNHHHLPSLNKNIGDVNICIELHRGLYPDCPPFYPHVDFEKLLSTARSSKIGNIVALTFNDEETLQYIYQHAFHAPLTYETYKLINAADLIGFTEQHYRSLDTERIRSQFPLLLKALPSMQHISPWDPDKVPKDFIASKDPERKPPTPFRGWPHKRRKEFQAENQKLRNFILATFVPSRWWVGIYYGETNVLGYIWCLLWKHPRHLLWWVKLSFALRQESRFVDHKLEKI